VTSARPGGHLIGLIADTHGLVRPECARALAGVELILHAGDVGGAHVLAALATIAPVRAVCGNTDPPESSGLAAALDFDLDGITVHVSHGHELLVPTPARLLARYPADVIVFGHTHRAVIVRRGARLVVNPGSAGPRRFRRPPTVARLFIRDGRADAELVPLG
jgi:putative phosphoesterase